MNSEYTFSFRWKAVIVTCVVAMVPLCVLFVFTAQTELAGQQGRQFVVYALALGIFVMTIAAVVQAFTTRLIIRPDFIVIQGLRGGKKIAIKDIAGIRYNNHYAVLHSYDEQAKPVKVSLSFAKRGEWLGYLRSTFEDLDARDLAANRRAALADTRYGNTPGARRSAFVRWHKITRMLNWTAVGLTLWCMVHPEPYALVVVLTAAMPLAGAFLLHRGDGRVTFHGGNKDPRPSVVSMFVWPLMALCLRAFRDFSVLDYTQALWLAVMLTTVTVLLMHRVWRADITAKAGVVLYLSYGLNLVFSGIFYFCTLILLNCSLDHSQAWQYTATVEQKDTSGEDSITRYTLKLGRWGTEDAGMEVSISAALFDATSVGETVAVYRKKGLLGIPWVFVE